MPELVVGDRKFDPYLSGTRSGIATTRSGPGAKDCSSESGLAIPIGITGMLVLWSWTKSPNQFSGSCEVAE